ncbi:dTDP-4-dehydrorhamnose reductase [Rhizobiales bacterium GAS191]|nr:dTDP-4-dehydrorhamnose reductase [Rhizobiales bacterium GAS191]
MTTSKRRIVILGANGNVGTEISLILRHFTQYDLVPVCRSRQGSSYLRYMGVPCAHGAVTDSAQAVSLLAKSTVIANFALAYTPTGSPRELWELNRQIVASVFANAPGEATILHFSTISVYGDGQGRGAFGLKSSYGAAKLSIERTALEHSRKSRKRLYVLRLGHVLGDLQNLSRSITDEIAAARPCIPFPDRASNTTFTATIADAIIKAADDELGAPGVYDLLNVPQLTWNEVYQIHAERAGLPLITSNETKGDRPRWPLSTSVAAIIGAINRHPFIRQQAMKLLAFASPDRNQQIRATHLVEKARSEIRALRPAPQWNQALEWRETGSKFLTSLTPTRALLVDARYRASAVTGVARWPVDVPESG